ncbi:sensor histidine kinase [Hymenobacter terrestris]|uniref:Sensor histidine kinase n=1 Tax=Hymenobacter terrestris TaxID=2748310 RepID=A0ABX2Q0D5_9BACT|nr:histidine kinase [Hymenobacter terrestris]NVO83747.1 sensor histidine kinase [Hymenobacter terrestris]
MLIQRPGRSDLLLVLVYWLLAAPIIFYSYLQDFGLGRATTTILYTVGLDTLAVYVLVFGLLPLALSRSSPWVVLGALVMFIAIDAHLYWLGYWVLLDDKPLQWTPTLMLYTIMRHTQSYGLLGVLMAGKRYFDVQKRLLQTQQAQTQSELRNLKAQLDPHFLFNNLNVLRGLIQQDPAEANEYLNRFAGLYRLLVRNQNEDFVTVSEELRFAEEYIYLLRHRFGTAYEFRLELLPGSAWDQRLVVPGTLQQLLENAIKHNAGNEDDPLVIEITATADSLTVRHPRRPKLTAVDSTGTGLANLRERYRLLFDQEIRVVNTAATFAVTVPVLIQSPVRVPADVRFVSVNGERAQTPSSHNFG